MRELRTLMISELQNIGIGIRALGSTTFKSLVRSWCHTDPGSQLLERSHASFVVNTRQMGESRRQPPQECFEHTTILHVTKQSRHEHLHSSRSVLCLALFAGHSSTYVVLVGVVLSGFRALMLQWSRQGVVYYGRL